MVNWRIFTNNCWGTICLYRLSCALLHHNSLPEAKSLTMCGKRSGNWYCYEYMRANPSNTFHKKTYFVCCLECKKEISQKAFKLTLVSWSFCELNDVIQVNNVWCLNKNKSSNQVSWENKHISSSSTDTGSQTQN